MSDAITKSTTPDMAAIEQVLVGGDLSKLTPAQRVTYYNRTCESLGLNPLSRPFEYIVLNDKLTLYARRDATDQLRRIHSVSVTIKSREIVDGVYAVSTHARTPDGREDESTGAVPVLVEDGEWKQSSSGKRYFQGNGTFKPMAPADRANAMMKAETKAKRRVTLSICGLGFTDESEVSDIPGAKTVQVDPQTGEISDAITVDASPVVDFDALLEKASTIDELKAIGKDINAAGQAGRITPELRKALGDKYKSRQSALANGVAA